MTCSRSWELRAIDEGRLAAADIAAFERHARTCASCHAELAARNDLAHLVSQIEAPVPTDLDLRRLRGKVLRDAMSASPSRAPRFAIGAIAAMAAALLLVKVTMRTKALTPEPFAAVVMPVPSAAWTQTREQRLERVTLTSGDVELRVRKQDAGERFLVVVPDGEVEVRGTTFEVSVHDGQTTRVHVDDGVVIVRVHGDTTLHAGESWPAPPQSLADVTPVPSAVLPIPTPTATVTAAHVSSSQKPPVATPHDHPTLSPSAAPSNDQEMADYERAISVYRSIERRPQSSSPASDVTAATAAAPGKSCRHGATTPRPTATSCPRWGRAERARHRTRACRGEPLSTLRISWDGPHRRSKRSRFITFVQAATKS
jgi:hypothetical protein